MRNSQPDQIPKRARLLPRHDDFLYRLCGARSKNFCLAHPTGTAKFERLFSHGGVAKW